MFKADIENNKEQISREVEGKSLCVIGGAGDVYKRQANCCISLFCIYVLYRFLSAVLRNIRYQIDVYKRQAADSRGSLFAIP